MSKFFRLVAGKKFYADEKGILLKDAENNFVETPETDTTATEAVVNEDEGVAEVEKMLKKAVEQVKKSAMKDLGESQVGAIEAVGALFKSITETAKKSKIADTEVKASFDVEGVQKGIADLANRQRSSFAFTISGKSDLGFLLKSTDKGDLTGDVIVPQLDPTLTRTPVRQIFIESIADVTPNMTSDNLSYVECVSETGAPLPTAELATMPEKDFTFQEYKAPLKKITVTNKHSVELLSDASQLVNAIKGWLADDVNIVTDLQLLSGNGTGANLQGVIGRATLLDATAVGTKRVALANLYDVIRLALTKVAVAGKGQFLANYVILNPTDADELDLTKDSTGNYVLPPFRSADGTTIKGARIIENTGMTAGTFLVGDFRKLHVGTKGGVEIEMTNADGTDFVKDILTVKLRRRVASYVRINDNGAFQTGVIATVKSALIAV